MCRFRTIRLISSPMYTSTSWTKLPDFIEIYATFWPIIRDSWRNLYGSTFSNSGSVACFLWFCSFQKKHSSIPCPEGKYLEVWILPWIQHRQPGNHGDLDKKTASFGDVICSDVIHAARPNFLCAVSVPFASFRVPCTHQLLGRNCQISSK